MNKKEARKHALRYACAVINSTDINSIMQLPYIMTRADADKVLNSVFHVAESLEKQALKIGGNFNIFSGEEI
jgi:hypothetical protein